MLIWLADSTQFCSKEHIDQFKNLLKMLKPKREKV